MRQSLPHHLKRRSSIHPALEARRCGDHRTSLSVKGNNAFRLASETCESKATAA
ncbi:hypothetical protein SAMN00790413_05142 [Deinococcus hopiensis KR-140]|uniref:Uncharacterized protein n=1 Tax=Deinococcus hopiensis KR-140 TaxID=695939 RepID=A0A1W1UTI1_9DEIO|nr:hypothetical protein SAMN00790413_05142 [Deinococcus hopiensis KR-140]